MELAVQILKFDRSSRRPRTTMEPIVCKDDQQSREGFRKITMVSTVAEKIAGAWESLKGERAPVRAPTPP